MKVHVLQHVPFEDIGSMALWLNARRAEVSYTRFFENAVLPEINDLNLIVAMGGPMSVNDRSEFPWLRAEKKFLRDAIARGISVLGVCSVGRLLPAPWALVFIGTPKKRSDGFQSKALIQELLHFNFQSGSTYFIGMVKHLIFLKALYI